MNKSIIELVKEHDANWNYCYTEYRDKKPIRKFAYEQVRELRKTNIVIII